MIHQRIGAAGITDFAGGPGFDQLSVRIPINPTLPEHSFIDGSGSSKLNFAVEQLVVDNSGFTGSVEWAALLDRVQASVSGTTSDVVFTDGADEVLIRGGVGATGQNVDLLALVEESGQVEAVIDGIRVVLQRGATILEPVDFSNIAPLQSLIFNPDETRLYGVDTADGKLYAFDTADLASPLQTIDTPTDSPRVVAAAGQWVYVAAPGGLDVFRQVTDGTTTQLEFYERLEFLWNTNLD